MPDDATSLSCDGDPRIDGMVRKAADVMELLLTADFLVGEYVTAHLAVFNLLAVSRAVGLTGEQRLMLVIWNTGLKQDPDDITETFDFILAVLQIRANVGRLPAAKLLDALACAYMRICRPDASRDEVLGDDPFAFIRYAVAGHLGYARGVLLESPVPDREDGAGEEGG